ncbi:MAG: hypothetical protein GTO24_26630 [candidate division Zixibacteria bacterium]|nr:hypothetical protein [candidate division Zixibacteria bacterium]
MSRIREEQDRLTTIILEELEKGELRHGDLLKQTLIRCGSRSKFSMIMRYLLRHGFIVKRGRKGGRAPYKITEKGRKQLSILESQS